MYQYRQSQCGQCLELHGERNYTNLQDICRTAARNGGFGRCKNGIYKNTKDENRQRIEVKREKWRDCENCIHRDEVHTIWTGNPA